MMSSEKAIYCREFGIKSTNFQINVEKAFLPVVIFVVVGLVLIPLSLHHGFYHH